MVAEGEVPSFVDDKMSPIVFLGGQRQRVTMSVLKQVRVSISFTVGSSGSGQHIWSGNCLDTVQFGWLLGRLFAVDGPCLAFLPRKQMFRTNSWSQVHSIQYY